MRILPLLLTTVLCGAFIGCPHSGPQPQPPAPDASDACVNEAGASLTATSPCICSCDAGADSGVDAHVDSGAPKDICAAAEAKLLTLQCKDPRGRLLGGPNLSGTKWADICRDVTAGQADMKPGCISVAKSCTEVEACR